MPTAKRAPVFVPLDEQREAQVLESDLRGKVKFLTGGKAEQIRQSPRARFGLIWCESRADSRVWTGEGHKACRRRNSADYR